jgi:hypothetical protein
MKFLRDATGPGILVPFSHLLSLFDDLHRGTGPIYLIWFSGYGMEFPPETRGEAW